MGGIGQELLPDSEYAKILAAMCRACAGRECCVADILKKLQRYKLGTSDTTKIITSLQADRFIDELRYAKAFVRDKSRLSGWGRTKIEWALKSKQIDREIIAEAISILSEEDVRAQLRKLLAGKLSILTRCANTDADIEGNTKSELYKLREKERAKLVRFGLSRGFEYDLVLSVVKELL